MGDSNVRQDKWAVFGKLSAGAVALSTVIGTVFAIYAYLSARADITVSVTQAEFRRPPEEESPAPTFLDYEGYFEITVSNDGGAQAENVVIDFPYRGIVEVRASDREPATQRFDDTLNVGIVRPGRTVEIYAWSRDAPASYNEDEIRVTHSLGTGTVLIGRETFTFWSAVGTHMPGFVWFVLVVVWLYATVIAVANVGRMIQAAFASRKEPAAVQTPEAAAEQQTASTDSARPAE